MTGISFDSEDLKVDYLSLNLRFNNLEQIKIIADFLASTFDCRSSLYDQSSKKRHLLVENNRCRYSAEFVVNLNKHWKGTTLRFKGKDAQWFYKDLKYRKLDWSIFDLEYTNLGRIDLCYDRRLKQGDKDLNLFLKILLNALIAKKITEELKSVTIFYGSGNGRVQIFFGFT